MISYGHMIFRYWTWFLFVSSRFGIDKTIASTQCTVSMTSHCNVTLKNHHNTVMCTITDVCQLQSLMADKTNVTCLDLSHNGLQVIPEQSFTRYPNIETLSLAFNQITDLSYEAFFSLNNLATLNLSGNPLRSFTGSIQNSFPSLVTVDASGILYWKPEKQMLQLSMLKNITGLAWSADCTDCSFYRTNVTWSPHTRYLLSYHKNCLTHSLAIDTSSENALLLNNTNFNYVCASRDLYCKQVDSYLRLVHTHSCWQALLTSYYCIIVLAALGAVLNLVVFVNILFSASLRINVSMLFVCSLAFSDFLVELYIICIWIYFNTASFSYIYANTKKNCLKIGLLWMLGQSSAVSMSLLLTLERYLVIVYAMKPNVRISRCMAKILICLSWLIAFFLTGYALYYNLYGTSLFCAPILFSQPKGYANIYPFTITVGSFALIFYLIIFLLYFHIYINAKRTANNAGSPGLQQESKLAQRIAMLVFSNVFFFVLPLVFSALIMLYGKYILITGVVSEIFKRSLPAFCVCINSFLDPILYAFRLPHFRQVLKNRMFISIWRKNSVQAAPG